MSMIFVDEKHPPQDGLFTPEYFAALARYRKTSIGAALSDFYSLLNDKAPKLGKPAYAAFRASMENIEKQFYDLLSSRGVELELDAVPENTKIAFEGNLNDSHWVHPAAVLMLRADCPRCAQPATAGIEEDEYPTEERALYFDCDHCGQSFQHAYRYKKVVYVIELTAAVAAVGVSAKIDIS